MGNNFMSKNADGSINMYCERLPDSGFIDAVKVRDICKIRILTLNEKKLQVSGSPDVAVQSLTGETYMVRRIDLLNNFTFLNGKRIKFMRMHANTVYTVNRICNELYKVMKIPDNCKGILNGNAIGTGNGVRKGNYLVCRVAQDGTIDKSSMQVVSADIFRKMFKISMQAIIQKHMGRHRGTTNSHFGLYERRRTQQARQMRQTGGMETMQPQKSVKLGKPEVVTGGIGTGAGAGTGTGTGTTNKISIQKPANMQPIRSGTPGNGTMGRAVNGTQTQMSLKDKLRQPSANTLNTANQQKRFKVTHRVLRQSDNKLIGFMVFDSKNNSNTFASIEKVMQMCECKVISNVMVATNTNNGAKYLRGNGIQISSLPVVLR